MATIIKTISFNNFFNYYGEYDDTQYDFEEGTNIIVADNGGGKSKFFNAFLWLFYDEVLDSETKRRYGIKDFGLKIISDKAKKETPIGDTVSCGIRLEYETPRKRFRIIKSIKAKKLDESITDNNAWSLTIDEAEVDVTDLVLPKYKAVYDPDKKREIINDLIQPSLRQYSFFQGEEVDRIIDFSKKNSIKEAINTLTGMSDFDELVKTTHYINEKAIDTRDKHIKESENASIQTQKDLEEKKALRIEIEKLEKEYENVRIQFENAEKEIARIEQNYTNAQKRQKLDNKIKEERNKLKTARDNYHDYLDKINGKFFDGNFAWLALGFDKEKNDFRDRITQYKETRYETLTLRGIEENPNDHFTILPFDSPDSVTLDKMIDDKHCYVCNRSAPEGSDAHKYLLKLKNRNNTSKAKPKFRNDLVQFFDNLQLNASPFFKRTDQVKDSVMSTIQIEKDLKGRVIKLEKNVKSLVGSRQDIIITGNDDESKDSDIIKDYGVAIKQKQQSEDRYNRIKGELNNKLKTLEDLNSKISKEAPLSNSDKFESFARLTRDIEEATRRTRDRVFDQMLKRLESYANIHFKDLIKYNEQSGGILKFTKSPTGTIDFNYIDSNGNLVSGASTGFQRMKIFSVVMAIISANTSNYNYPLLADAPLSEFGTGFIKSFFEEAGKIFPQSIILVKELYDKDNAKTLLSKEGEALLKESAISTFYVNTQEDVEQIELVTSKKRLK